MLPTSILNEIATVQALERRAGSVFYLDAKTATTKDGITSGATLASAKTGHGRGANYRTYGSQISSENVGIIGVAALTATLSNRAIVPGTVQVYDGLETFIDNGANVLVSNRSGASNGTVNYTTGGISLTWTNHTPTQQPVAQYAFKYENATAPTSGVIVPSVDFSITAETVTALDFTLQTKFTMAAMMDLKKAHGMDLESEAVRILGGELKFAQDHYGIDKMYAAATDPGLGAGTGTTFNATVGSGQEFVWRKFQFNDSVEEVNNLIFNKTLRGCASFLVCGNNVARLIKQLKPDFVPVSNLGTVAMYGPTKIGTLNGRTVIQDPFLPTNQYIAGYKGESFLQSAFIYAPYIPLFNTPTLTTSDLVAQKGFMSSSGFKVINAGLFANASISGL
jgi:hypothetical protein